MTDKPVTFWEREMVTTYDMCGKRPTGHCHDCGMQRVVIEEIRARIAKQSTN